MNLRIKLLLTWCFFFIVQLIVVCTLFEKGLNPKISQLEQNQNEKNLTRNLELLRYELSHLQLTGQLISLLPSVKNVLTAPISDEASPIWLHMMVQQKLNLLYILNSTDQVLLEKIINLNTLETYPSATFLPSLWKTKPDFLKPTSNQNFQTGIYNSFLGPVLIVSGPILSSEKNNAIIGTLVIGKLITSSIIDLFENITFSDMQLWPLEGATLSQKHQIILKKIEQTDSNLWMEKTAQSFRGYVSLPDLNQKMNLLISTSTQRDFSEIIKMNLINMGACLILLQVIFMLLLSWFIRQHSNDNSAEKLTSILKDSTNLS